MRGTKLAILTAILLVGLAHNSISIADSSTPADAGQIAFVSDRDGEPNIWLMNVDGSDLRKLTSYRGEDPSWSPDGQKIAFVHGDGLAPLCAYGGENIYVINADGSELQPLTLAGGCHPSWSPDGQEIAYDNVEGIWTMDPDGSKKYLLIRNTTTIAGGCGRYGDCYYVPIWSPNWDKIAFMIYVYENSGLGVINRDGSGFQGYPQYVMGFAWSPDSQKILFLREGSLFLLEVGSGEVTDISSPLSLLDPECPGRVRATAWVPSQRIAFSCENRLYLTDEEGNFFLLLVEGEVGEYFEELAWSPDGTMLAFTWQQGISRDIWVVNAGRSTGLTNLTKREGRNWSPTWRP